MSKPRLLDVFAGEGGATRGYMDAGFEVTAVDLNRRALSRNPAEHRVVSDGSSYICAHGAEYDLIHASPPCQRYSRGTAALDRSRYPDLIAQTREALIQVGRPYVIENVADAKPLLRDPVLLCGTMFQIVTMDTDGVLLHLRRHRLFEATFDLKAPRGCHHKITRQVGGAYNGAPNDKTKARMVRHGGYVPSLPVMQRLMGDLYSMTTVGVYECIPPVYAEWIGRAWLRA